MLDSLSGQDYPHSMHLARPLLPTLALILSGCQGDPHLQSCTMLEKKPVPEEIAGSWKPSKDPFKTSWCPAPLKRQLQTHPMQLTLSKDGTFLYRNFSTAGISTPSTWSEPEDMRGTWTIEEHHPGSGGTSYAVTLNFRKNETNETVSATFYGKRPDCLIFTCGDPDNGEAVFLDKTK